MKKGFTLIELLIVIALIAILAIAVLLTINPIALLEQGRDVTRISDMSTLNKAVSLYYQDAMSDPSTMFMGTSSVIYISVPDPVATSTAGDQCQGLGLATLPTGYSYHCAASSTYTKVDGTGWIPINFSAYSAGTVISKLPVDPTNTTSTGLYYSYATDGVGGYKIDTFFESQKDAPQMASDGGTDPALYEKGTNLSLASGRGLIGYWPLNEGTGAIAYDGSGIGNNMTVTPSTSWMNSGCQINTNCLSLTGANFHYAYSLATSTFQLTNQSFTFSEWVNLGTQSNIASGGIVQSGGTCEAPQLGGWMLSYTIFSWCTPAQIGTATYGTGLSFSTNKIATGTWTMITISFNTIGNVTIYENGTSVASAVSNGIGYTGTTSTITIGCQNGGGNCSQGLYNDVRLYNRALSAAEVQEMYNAEE